MQITDPELADPVRHRPLTKVERLRRGQWRLLFALFPEPAPTATYERSKVGRQVSGALSLARAAGGWLR